jgi:ribosomal protein S18 acetylase RimI-like enzyme
MMTEIVIRPAQPSDIPALLPLIAKICALHKAWDPAKYGFLPNPERLYQGWLSQILTDDRDLCLIAEPQEADSQPAQLIAFLIATVEREIPIYALKEFGFIHDLWVEQEYRQVGVARQLVTQTIAHFTQLGVEQIRLDTAIANDAARSLFASCGFRPSTVEMLIELGVDRG